MSHWKKVLQYDIKEYLTHLIEQKKKKNPRFSQRAFANQIGLSSTTLNETLKGKRRLSKKTIAKLKTALENDTEFFEVLEEAMSPFSTFRCETSEMIAVASAWYHHVILELCYTESFSEDAEWISNRLGIPLAEAKGALEALLNANELKRNQYNRLIPTYKNSIKVSDEESRELVTKTAIEYLQKAQDAVRLLPMSERFGGNMVIACSRDDMDYIQTKAVEFMKDCNDYLSRASVPKEDVFLLNVGFTPLTKRIETKN